MGHICLLSFQRQSFLPPGQIPLSPSFVPSASPSPLLSCLCQLFPALCPSGRNKYPFWWKAGIEDLELIHFFRLDTTKVQCDEPVRFIEVTYRSMGESDQKSLEEKWFTNAHTRLTRGGNQEHNAQLVGSTTDCSVSFSDTSVGQNHF